MKTLLKDVIRLGLILTAFTVVACVGLAFVNQVTKPIIDGLDARRTEQSLKNLFAGAESFEMVPEFPAGAGAVKFASAYLVSKGGQSIGLAVKAAGPTYGGDTVLLVGVGSDAKVAGVIVLDNKDTPGLGANAKNPNYYVDKASKTTFPGQFRGKPLSDPFEAKKDVIAITASTITSRGIAVIVKQAGDAATAYLAAHGGKQ
ncbi:MAG: FMN-binding protein [Spirochaetes bacterium]|nr:FMN-binding protein [Spirochaetota bacterium]